MTYQITSDNIDLSESMKELAREKISKIESRFPNLTEDEKQFRVVMNSAPNEKFSIKVEAKLGKKSYYSDETSFTLENALVATVEEIERMVKKDSDYSTTWNGKRENKRFKPEEDET